MNIFAKYSRYYDLLYRDKDYQKEADFIFSNIKQFLPQAKDLLDLGCGTGKHLAELHKKGLDVCGVDMSEDMIQIARKEFPSLRFAIGDIAKIDLQQEFDVVTSLFHVMSYQTSNEKLEKCFKTAYKHLNTDGLLIFDCWYGPGVLTDKPTTRIKELEDDKIKVFRIAEPRMHANQNIVDVNYTVIIIDKETQKVEVLEEKHEMRYLFKPEIEYLLHNSGFQMVKCVEFMTEKEPDYNSWSVIFVANKM